MNVVCLKTKKTKEDQKENSMERKLELADYERSKYGKGQADNFIIENKIRKFFNKIILK